MLRVAVPTVVLLSSLSAQSGLLRLEDWSVLARDEGFRRDGRPTLHWPQPAANTTPVCRGLPADLTPYRTFSFWVHVERPTASTFTIVFRSENPLSEGIDYYAASFKSDVSGWRRIALPLAGMRITRRPRGWDQIDALILSSNWAHDMDPDTVIHLQDIELDTAPIPGCETSSGELLANRSFEHVPGTGSGPAGWSVASFDTESSVHIDSTRAATGRHSIRIDGTRSGRAGLSCAFGPGHTDPNAVYLLSATVRIAGSSTHDLRTSARITSVGHDGRVLKSDYRLCARGPHDWRRYEWEVRLPEGTERFNLVLFHHGEGQAWWDDVSLLRAQPMVLESPVSDTVIHKDPILFRWDVPLENVIITLAPEEQPDARIEHTQDSGTTSRIPPPAEPGWYVWGVRGTDGDGALRVGTACHAEGKTGAPRIFVGTPAQAAASIHQLVNDHAALARELEDVAARNGMWDRFSVLTTRVADLNRQLRTPQEQLGTLRAQAEALESDLALYAPWWKRIFLDDEALFAGLRLDMPGLEQVRDAVTRGDCPAARTALWQYYRERDEPTYYGRWRERPPWNPARRSVARADQLLTHRMPIHSYNEPTFDLGPDFNWHVFPIVDVEWPTKIHRHFHWDQLAGAYWQTGNEAYAKEVVLQLLDWGQDNPMERWDRNRYRWAWSTLNATVRIYSSWINAWLRIRRSDAWTADAQFVMLTLLREHGRFLMTHAARQGNWVVAEARGLVELGIMFPEFAEADAWRREGYRRLRREIDVQVLPDGVHVERTPGYHSMTMGCFMSPLQLGQTNGIAIDGWDHFVRKLEDMHEFYLYACRPDRRMAQIGDGGMMNIVSAMHQGWNMFRRNDMLWVATAGREGEPPVHTSYAFAHAGFYVSRSAWTRDALWSIIDWGGFLGHCHEDMGHISVAAFGANLLIDSGRYSYAWPMRAPFYQTVGHNTVMVDGQTQKRRDPLARFWVSGNHVDVFQGLTDNSEPLLHQRSLLFRKPDRSASPGYWLVLDRLTGPGRHRLDQRWHASDTLTGEILAGRPIVRLSPKTDQEPGAGLVIAGLPAAGLRTAVVAGSVSYAWYRKTPVDVVQFSLDTDMPATLATVLLPTQPGASQPDVTVQQHPAAMLDGAEPDAAATALTVTVTVGEDTWRDLWVIRHSNAGTVSAQSLRTDAQVSVIHHVNGRRRGAALVSGTYLYWNDVPILTAASTVDLLACVSDSEGTWVECTAAQAVSVAGETPCYLRGQPCRANRDNGLLVIGTVPPAPAPPEPRAPGPVTIALPEPERPIAATGFCVMLPRDDQPTPAIVVNAAAPAAEGGGTVEKTDSKVGADGPAFLHWDNQGHWLQYGIDVPADGIYRLILRACTAEARALRSITVNGRVIPYGQAMEFAGTGGYSNATDDWRLFMPADTNGQLVDLDLRRGKTTLRLENIDGSSLNLNWIGLIKAEP